MVPFPIAGHITSFQNLRIKGYGLDIDIFTLQLLQHQYPWRRCVLIIVYYVVVSFPR